MRRRSPISPCSAPARAAAISAAPRWTWTPARNSGAEGAMEFRLTDAQRQMVASVRELAQGNFRQRALRWMDGTFPWENIRELASLGVLGMSVPEEYGGLGLPVFETALVLEEIAKVCYPTAIDRKSTRLNSSHANISYAVFCLKKKK